MRDSERTCGIGGAAGRTRDRAGRFSVLLRTGLLGLVLALAACGFEPVYAPGGGSLASSLRSVSVDQPSGRIGQAIVRRCHFGFGCRIVYVNRSAKQVDFPAEQLAMDTALAGADVVVLATPGGADTHHLIGTDEFAQMQSHAIFVNISRGDVVDEAALVAALSVGRIAGAGLDVYEFEPAVPDELRVMENVTLLPHLGTAALEVREDMGRMALDNLIAFTEGKPAPNAV